MNFTDLGLSPEVLKAVGDAGYEQPTPIQVKAIPYVLMGRDVLGCAQTGTGKTASFTLPMIDILASGRARARMPRSLILTPTRELATQISENFEIYGKYNKLSMALLIGGSSVSEQERRLERSVDVLIATPGRLLDLFERGRILLPDVKILVIDEADRMLDMGFMPDVARIVGLLPKIRQTLFFSATMPPEIRRLADSFLMNPKEIAVDPPATAAETVTQTLVRVSGEQKEKRAALRALLRGDEITSALIFCNRKRDVDIVFRSLKRHGFDAAALHGDMAQPVRIETLERFKAKEVRILVCSDVAARGLDIPKVSHVINFDVPVHAEDYVHRIGRTGRAGRSGEAVTLALPEEAGAVSGVNAMLGRPIPEVTLDGVAGWAEGDAPRRDSRRRPRRGRDGGPAKARHERGSAPAKARHERPNAPPKRAAAEKHAEKPAEKPAKKSVTKKTAKKAATEKSPAKPAKKAAGKPADSGSFGGHVPAFLQKPVKVA